MDWPTLGGVLALVTAWSAIMLWAVKQMHATQTLQLAAVEKDLVDLRLEISREYVRREDWIRFGGTLDAKMDRMHKTFDTKLDRMHETLNELTKVVYVKS